MHSILIVEDEPIIRSALRRLLERHAFHVCDAGSVDLALQQGDLNQYDLIISDLRLPGRPGTDLIELAQGTPVLIMTSYASMRSAVDAMKQGAVDYIAKPFDHDELLASVREFIKKHRAQQTAAAATPAAPAPDPITQVQAPTAVQAGQEPDDVPSVAYIIGNSPSMRELLRRIGKVARTHATVLIQGESGTGKELAARAIHQLSPRAQAPMISVNCAAIPDTLIESELFGHEKGAFTGAVNSHNGLIEAADGGTLFLDEIGELPLDAQARLLRVLQEGEIRRVGSVTPRQVDIRLIAATHRELKLLTRNGKFREDLFYRLYIMEIRMPPLREREDDILELAHKFLLRTCDRMGCQTPAFSPASLQAMRHYQWPGNVRELENAIERAVIMSEGDLITPELLSLDMPHSDAHRSTSALSAPPAPAPQPKTTPRQSLEAYFQQFVEDHQHQMTETELAKQLGISRKTLWERRQRLGIPRSNR